MLALLVRTVADPDRTSTVVTVKVIDDLLVEVALAVDAVHDLQFFVALGHIGDEEEEVVGFPIETERVQRPECEGGVAHPCVAVVPVALAARRLW